jgi:ACS family hexuronate transporter-like MFS transporter
VRPIRNLRWWIGALLFASTVINYIDRQTLALLSPYLKQIYHWTNSDYANLLIGFRIAYSVGQTVCGRLMDRLGTRRGLTLSVLWYSIVSIVTSLAGGFYSFATFRFLLGAGESANWPGATKAVAEWFPKRERALATALLAAHRSGGLSRPS